MFQQTFWAALRNLTQIYAQSVGGAAGMRIIQTTQLFNLLGSGGGFQLCANSFVAMLSGDEARTANFGILGGIFMLGSSIGYTLGGTAERYLGYLAPFQLAFVLLCFSTVFGMFFLPHFTPEHKQKPDARKTSFLAPLKVFIPRKVGNRRDYNLLFLGLGTFFSVLATGYAPMMLQLIATDVFDFTPYASGYMLSLTLFVRFIFLSGLFPRIIATGRRWVTIRRSASMDSFDSARTITRTPHKGQSASSSASTSRLSSPDRTPRAMADDIPRCSSPSPASSGFFHAPITAGTQQGNFVPSQSPAVYSHDSESYAPTRAPHPALFDLLFLRCSILLDGILTAVVTLSSHPWHMYAAASVLPFASGTGPASKGVMLEFVAPEDRPDAMSAIALVEKLAQVSTIGLFGFLYAWLSEKGVPTLVFVANGAVAVLGFLVLLPVRLPRT